jgi:CheY-like chemotaxis protein
MMRVLLIEDDALVRATLADWMSDDGIDVDGLASAEDALVLLGAGQVPDVLVTDINLGHGLDGLDLADVARARHPDIEVVYISGRPFNMHGRELGPHESFIAKPFTVAQLMLAIRNAAGRSAAGRVGGC